jgi:hypothetical protein
MRSLPGASVDRRRRGYVVHHGRRPRDRARDAEGPKERSARDPPRFHSGAS